MSFIGSSPTIKRIRYTPQASDPVNPIDGDFYFSNGTPRAEGPWVYFNSAWQQVSVSGALTTVNYLTFTPQASDPGGATEGTVFYADGTSRAEGMWLYSNGGWVQLSGVRFQEFYVKDYIECRVATTANITLASQAENGDSIDGIVLATNDLLLVKNQTTATENGVYVVQASGAPIRDTSANTFTKLNQYSASIVAGTVNKNTYWFQTAVLASLATNQVWAATPPSFSFTIPSGIDAVSIEASGGGGSGGGGGGHVGNGTAHGGGGGSGGSGAPYVSCKLPVTTGTITVNPGKGGLRISGSANNSAASPGNAGASTTLVYGSVTLTFPGGAAGLGGAAHTSSTDGVGGVQSSTVAVPDIAATKASYGGAGETGGASSGVGGSAGQSSVSAAGGLGLASSRGGGGGGGGACGPTAGADGGMGASGSYASTVASTMRGRNATNKGAGGGGGGAAGTTSGSSTDSGAPSGHGGVGYIRISW